MFFLNLPMSSCSKCNFLLKIYTPCQYCPLQTLLLHLKNPHFVSILNALSLFFIKKKLHFLILEPFVLCKFSPRANSNAESSICFKDENLIESVSENHSHMVVFLSRNGSLKKSWCFFASEKQNVSGFCTFFELFLSYVLFLQLNNHFTLQNRW